MADPRTLLSVGIDVGTTTTQVVFSRLTLQDTARPGQIPRIGITDKSVVYQSPIVFTPLADRETVDAARLTELVRREYAAAGVDPAQVETGAVIITGETAKKKNADEILRALAGLAGEFVVTVAGPHLESLIAGRGAGAAAYSQEHFARVTNVDIGGGSANSALFQAGALAAAAAMNYGGRIVEIEHATGRVRHLAEPALAILADLGLRLAVGDAPSLADLRRFTDRMADLTVELIEGGNSPLAQKLYLTPPAPVSGRGSTLMLSGGIGHYFYEPLPIQLGGRRHPARRRGAAAGRIAAPARRPGGLHHGAPGRDPARHGAGGQQPDGDALRLDHLGRAQPAAPAQRAGGAAGAGGRLCPRRRGRRHRRGRPALGYERGHRFFRGGA